MIYPQKINSRKWDLIIKLSILISIIIGLILFIINILTTPSIKWSALANCGIIYIWLTVMYSIKKGNNIAGHVLMQTIFISIVLFYIDKTVGFIGWSLYIAIPVVLIIANITMLILTIISYKKYIKYANYQLMIVLMSMMPIILVIKKIIELNWLIRIALEVSIFSLIISLILSYKDIKEAIIRKIHI